MYTGDPVIVNVPEPLLPSVSEMFNVNWSVPVKAGKP